jgi:hypothetical protein
MVSKIVVGVIVVQDRDTADRTKDVHRLQARFGLWATVSTHVVVQKEQEGFGSSCQLPPPTEDACLSTSGCSWKRLALKDIAMRLPQASAVGPLASQA